MNADDPNDAPKAAPDATPDPGPGEGERIAKVLARAGVASRRDCERLVLEGRVTLNGAPVTSPAVNVGPLDRLAVDGRHVDEAEPTRLWLYHKPAGLVTTERDEEGRETVFDRLPDDMPRVMSVGRLDLTSEGLLILTNDGEIKRRLELPSTGWLRRYRARVSGALSEESLDELRRGVSVEGVDYQPMEVEFDRQQGANAWLTIGLREGKNREIRRVMEHLGVQVSRLIRVSYGPFQLGNIAPGEVEEVRAKVVRDQLGLAAPAPRAVRAGRRAPEPEAPQEPAARAPRPRLATRLPAGATTKRALKPVIRARGEAGGGRRARRGPSGGAAQAGPQGGRSQGGRPVSRAVLHAQGRPRPRRLRTDAAFREAKRAEREAARAGAKPRSTGFRSHGGDATRADGPGRTAPDTGPDGRPRVDARRQTSLRGVPQSRARRGRPRGPSSGRARASPSRVVRPRARRAPRGGPRRDDARAAARRAGRLGPPPRP
jgi:23S rRNA pseudouridine2605 synthase